MFPSVPPQENLGASSPAVTETAAAPAVTLGLDLALFADTLLAEQVAHHGLGVSPSTTVPLSSPTDSAVPIMAAMDSSPVIGAETLAVWNGNVLGMGNAGSSGIGWASGGASDSVHLSFHRADGQLTLDASGGHHTVQEASTADGFVQVTVDGRSQTSNPHAATFDPALTGVTAATLTRLHLVGSGQDTLIVGTQRLGHGLTLEAVGSTVITQQIVTAGPLAIQAANLSIHDHLQASQVTLAAANRLIVDAGACLDGTTGVSGGMLSLSAGTLVNSGQLHADGVIGGEVTIQAGNILNAGPVTADGNLGSGGQVHVDFIRSYIATAASVVSASSVAGLGGQVSVNGNGTGHLYSSGRQLATGSMGGTVALLGKEAVLAGATVDVSGRDGGGQVRIGGSATGPGPVADTTEVLTATPSSTIQASAWGAGPGGQVFLEAGQSLAFAGRVSARGGPTGGAGGFIDVSSPGNVRFAGVADAGATQGTKGTFLLDPKNLVIGAITAGAFPQFDLTDPHPTAGGNFGSVVVVLSNGNVLVTNPKDDFGGNQAGAAYLFDGSTGALLSALVGSNPGDQVGDSAVALSNGNYVVGSLNWNQNRGAVTWGSGSMGVSGMVSEANSLVGSTPGDDVGGGVHIGPSPGSIIPLSNGNYLISSLEWNNTAGAVTWGNGTTGTSGTVSEANSLIGSNPGDLVGQSITLLNNGNYVVDSPGWSAATGAVTWGDGRMGVRGIVSAANSLVGSNPGDWVGTIWTGAFGYFGVTALSNGNYVVSSPSWNDNRGALSWGDGSRGVMGLVSENNSLVGSSSGDQVGTFHGVTLLNNGNYVVGSPAWNGNRGAVTWGDGRRGVTGVVSAGNSLVGSNPGDHVSSNGVNILITALSNGNYVVASPNWNGARGAATWGDGNSGSVGAISAANSLVGSPGDQVGGSVTALTNGNYVVTSLNWNSGRGAATWGDGRTGIRGSVSVNNSLIGSTPYSSSSGDQVGGSVTALTNGNYVVSSPNWNAQRGAATWGNGSTGASGVVSSANSLVGNPGDQVGYSYDQSISIGVTALSNGNYVVTAGRWNGQRGAVTWGDGLTGTSGTVSADNSLVGSNPGDLVGGGLQYFHGTGLFIPNVTALSNGNYIVESNQWNGQHGAVTWGNGRTGTSGVVSEVNSLVGSNPGDFNPQIFNTYITRLSDGNYLVQDPNWNSNRGAVTWGNGSTGVSGIISAANSLVGSAPGDQVGKFSYRVGPRSSGNYVIDSPYWNGQRGAVTWGNGSTGTSGIVSAANSFIGTNPGDFVGFPTIIVLSNGDYVVPSAGWNDNRGAVTWVSGTSGQTLDGVNTITQQNSLTGNQANASLGFALDNPVEHTFLAPFVSDGGGRVVAGFATLDQLTYATAQDQSLTIAPDFLARTLDTGTAVVLQASNDLTVNDPITVHAGGQGGALTLAAGRSVLLNASITTDNGPLTLIANDQPANGVVDAERDPGPAVIRMASGTVLDSGAAALTVDLRDGAGLTNPQSGPILLQDLRAGSVSVVNQGPSPGSDLLFGTVTSRGPQSYASLHGTTCISGQFTAADNAITLRNAVLLVPGSTLDGGASTVNVTQATLTLLPGQATVPSGLVLDAATSVSATLLPGSASQLVVHGPIQLGDSTLTLLMGFQPPVGSRFEILTNAGSVPIVGTFAGLAEGATFTAGGAVFQITYQGGSGGDSVVLTCVG